MAGQKQISWSAKAVISRRDEVRADINSRFPESPEDKLSYLLGRISGDGDHEATDILLDQFVHVILTLECHADHGGLKASDVSRLFETAERILITQGIDRTNSRLSFLHAELFRIRSQMALGSGDPVGAIWQAEMAKAHLYRPTERMVSDHALTEARALLRHGHVSLAIAAYHLVEQEGPESPYYSTARIERACALRISGDRHGAQNLLLQCQKDDLDETSQRRIDWELSVIEFLNLQKPELLLAKLRKTHRTFGYHMEAKLWLFALRSKNAHEKLAKAESLRKRFRGDDADLQQHAELYKAVRFLDEAHESDNPLTTRLEKMGDCLSQIPQLPSLDHEVLVLGSLARFAQRFSQESVLQFAINELQSLGRRVTRGLESDPWELVGDSKAYDISSLKDAEREYVSAPEGSKIKRNLKMGKLVGRSAGIVISNRIRRILANEEERQRLRDEELRRVGQEMYESLSDMKGGVMKFGQHLGFSFGVPSGLADQISGLHDRSAPIDPKVSIKVVEREFGKSINEIFAEWDPNPIAVGSVGQVFLAKTQAGEEVAVKVRHPGIAEALRSDLGSLFFIKPILKQLMPHADVNGLMNEFNERILAETDYLREAEDQEDFRKLVKDDPEIVIPKVHRDLSTERVLTMEYIHGRSFAEFNEFASQEERNRAAITMVRMNAVALYHGHMFNGDPHPGNYLFQPDGTVAFLDFGCVKRFSPGFIESYLKMQLASLTSDLDMLREGLVGLNFIHDPDNFDYEAQMRLQKISTKPVLKDEVFSFTADYARELQAIHVEENPNIKKTTPPIEAVLLFRLAWGFSSILSTMNATANWHRILHDALDKIDNPFNRTA